MRREVAEAWVRDLRSNPPQTTTMLYDGRAHCCLGRLCVVLGLPPTIYEDVVLPDAVMQLADIKDQEGRFTIPAGEYATASTSLAALNDGGMTFSQIADMIDYFWEDL
jgi:hypothetical protein